MSRLTRPKDRYECRIAGGCPAEDWICECTNDGELANLPCATCPFEKYINKLAEYEDKEEEKLEFKSILNKIQKGEM